MEALTPSATVSVGMPMWICHVIDPVHSRGGDRLEGTFHPVGPVEIRPLVVTPRRLDLIEFARAGHGDTPVPAVGTLDVYAGPAAAAISEACHMLNRRNTTAFRPWIRAVNC